MVAAFIASLKTAVTDVVVATADAPAPGVVPTTVGGVVSAAAFTVTVVVAVAVPAAFAADSVEVVVAAGDTTRVPDADTAPIPGSIVTDAAFDTDHDTVELCPCVMAPGDAAKLPIVGAGGGGGGGVADEKSSAHPARHARSGLSGPNVPQNVLVDPMNGHK